MIETAVAPSPIESLLDSALAGAQFIVSQQHQDGCLPWFRGQIADPWDHVEAAMGLTVAGYHDQARRAYQWLAEQQNADGSWFSEYGTRAQTYHDLPDPALKQSHHGLYLATGLWHFWLATEDLSVVEALFSTVDQAVAFTLALQTEHGDVLWGRDQHNTVLDDALVTACCSIYKSLACALNLAELLALPRPQWARAYGALGKALRDKPHRFDRSWQSKRRYAMDWFYPVLSGVIDSDQAAMHLNQRWNEFVIADLGCLCVNDHPWVTVAETAELCLALSSAGMTEKARLMLTQLVQFQDKNNGGFWTGYVHTDEALWPEEQTTWTAAAVLLAIDSVLQLTPAANLFRTHRPE